MDKTGAAGFTLLELVITIAIAGILLAVAGPNFSSFIKDRQSQEALGQISRAVFTARSEAAKSGDTITVCARASNTQCGTDWNNGVLVFRDSTVVSTETQAVRDSTDEILRVAAPHGHQDITIRAVASTDRTAGGAYTPSFVRYRPDGRANWKNGTFSVCDYRGAVFAEALQIRISGDIRPARRLASDQPINDVFGRALTCS